MNPPVYPYQIFSLGDNAVTIDYGNQVHEALNREVISRFQQLKQQDIPWIRELVPAYSSLTVYYDLLLLYKVTSPGQTVGDWVIHQLRSLLGQPVVTAPENERLLRIPVCYEPAFAPDFDFFAREKKISPEELVALHTAVTYKVYMLGFLPGFAYMGEVDERIAVPRKPQPVNIVAGSVGIAGKQTGIYPLASPGGWQIIGRTPLRLFDKDSEEPALMRPGDSVQFIAISKEEFSEVIEKISTQSHGVHGASQRSYKSPSV